MIEALFGLGRQPVFHDRRHAGAQLAAALAKERGSGAIVLGIPRGGVPVADEVARALDLELDVIVSRKIGAPWQPELALGAITSDGGCYWNEELLEALRLTPEQLAPLAGAKMVEAAKKLAVERGDHPPPRLVGRTAILVDDGLATGATMVAAVRAVRAAGAARIIVAVPVGSREACAVLTDEADEVVCLHEPRPFIAVGAHYERFSSTRDEEVKDILERSRVR